MNIERFAFKLAAFWACFRMLADISSRTLFGLLRIGLIAAILWWVWDRFGPIL